MTKKIFRSTFLVSFVVFLACMIATLGFLYSYFSDLQQGQLRAELQLAAQGVENDGIEFLEGLNIDDYRITWINTDGSVIYDSMADADLMENHLNREEVQDALNTGTGSGVRTSTTLSERTYYLAQLLSDGTVLRLSYSTDSVFALLLGMSYAIIIVIVLAVVLSLLLSKRLANRIIQPLNKLDLDNPLENDTYEELSPLLTRIMHQHRQIDEQLEELHKRQTEFSAVTDNMSEGLVLLGSDGSILSINHAAMAIFGADSSAVGKDMLTIDRSRQIQELLNHAMAGKHSEIILSRNGREYQFNASPIVNEGKVNGVALLAFDITEKELMERQRREFSANVSHELKTPLHSIMGSAELIENGLVKADDMPRFVSRIRTEATRLVTLIDDIIRLSQLDEGTEMPKEQVDLLAIAYEAVEALNGTAADRHIEINVTGNHTYIYGVRRLLYEIAYNLCENAIKYNKEGGKVNIDVSNNSIVVSDTGIGIPPEHQSRVFERFYRVDKSHSRETGGTGLGLSIVKHAALYHGADIKLESHVDQGTKITVVFPDQNTDK